MICQADVVCMYCFYGLCHGFTCAVNGWHNPSVSRAFIGLCMCTKLFYVNIEDGLYVAVQVSWPLFLAQLSATQEAFLAGKGRGYAAPSAAKNRAGDGGVAGLERESPRNMVVRFEEALHACDASVGDGCTDAGSRLGHLIKAMAKAPSNATESVSKVCKRPRVYWTLRKTLSLRALVPGISPIRGRA